MSTNINYSSSSFQHTSINNCSDVNAHENFNQYKVQPEAANTRLTGDNQQNEFSPAKRDVKVTERSYNTYEDKTLFTNEQLQVNYSQVLTTMELIQEPPTNTSLLKKLSLSLGAYIGIDSIVGNFVEDGSFLSAAWNSIKAMAISLGAVRLISDFYKGLSSPKVTVHITDAALKLIEQQSTENTVDVDKSIYSSIDSKFFLALCETLKANLFQIKTLLLAMQISNTLVWVDTQKQNSILKNELDRIPINNQQERMRLIQNKVFDNILKILYFQQILDNSKSADSQPVTDDIANILLNVKNNKFAVEAYMSRDNNQLLKNMATGFYILRFLPGCLAVISDTTNIENNRDAKIQKKYIYFVPTAKKSIIFNNSETLLEFMENFLADNYGPDYSFIKEYENLIYLGSDKNHSDTNGATTMEEINKAAELLGLDSNNLPCDDEIIKRYREMLLQYHPDKNSQSQENIEFFSNITAEINNAKDILIRQ